MPLHIELTIKRDHLRRIISNNDNYVLLKRLNRKGVTAKGGFKIHPEESSGFAVINSAISTT